MTVKIISDGSSDLPTSVLEQYDITVVPLTVHFGDEVNTTSMDTGEFYAKMKKSPELPKTSSPSPHDFLKAYQSVPEDQDIVVIAVSSGLSSTYNHAVMAKDMLLEEGRKGSIEVLDSKTASIGLGLLAYRAARLAKAGTPFMDVIKNVKHHIQEGATYFVLDTLENVIKGGRLDRVRGTFASILNIKLLMRDSEQGTLEVLEKIRGSQAAIKRMIDKVGEASHDFSQAILGIAHCNCEERAKAVKDMILARYPFNEVIVSTMGPVIGTYAGEGGILVAY